MSIEMRYFCNLCKNAILDLDDVDGPAGFQIGAVPQSAPITSELILVKPEGARIHICTRCRRSLYRISMVNYEW